MSKLAIGPNGGLLIHPNGKLMVKNAAGDCCCDPPIVCDTPVPNDCAAGEIGNIDVTLQLEAPNNPSMDSITKFAPGDWRAGLAEQTVSLDFGAAAIVNPCQELLDKLALAPPLDDFIVIAYDNGSINITRQYFPADNVTAIKWNASIVYQWFSQVAGDNFEEQCGYGDCDLYAGDVCLTDSPTFATINALFPPNTLTITP